MPTKVRFAAKNITNMPYGNRKQLKEQQAKRKKDYKYMDKALSHHHKLMKRERSRCKFLVPCPKL